MFRRRIENATMRKKISLSGPSFKVFVIVVCFVLLQWINPGAGESAKPGGQKVPVSLIKWPEKGSPYATLVDKSLQKIFVYDKENPFKPFKTYNCSTGENHGPKTRRNDRRTPDGIYFFTHTLEDKDLAPIYGSKALVLDYHNLVDRTEGRDGYGIWFHGLNKPLKPTDTKGYVAVENGNIDDLASLITLGDSPVIISEKIEMVDPSELEKQKKELVGVIERWKNAG
jgi:murein L,D-transpeptidase YafK